MNYPDLIQRLPQFDRDTVPASVEDFLRGLAGPTWLEVTGRDESRTRVVVSLLHGNEPSGLRAIHAWLRSGHEPAVNTIFYLGSISAALHEPVYTHRALPGERDANRCYGPFEDDRQGRIAQAFTHLFHQFDVEALVDIHNNTGHNPAYGIGYGVDAARLNLTNLFADWYVASDLCMHTLVEMSSVTCPSISLECGRVGDPAADATALAGLERFLHLDNLGLTDTPSEHLKILRQPRRVFLLPHVEVAFANVPHAQAGLTLRDDLDRHNFEVIEAGAVLGWVEPGLALPLSARDALDNECAQELFRVEGNVLQTRQAMIPIMMTTDAKIARSDCLFYAMEPSALA